MVVSKVTIFEVCHADCFRDRVRNLSRGACRSVLVDSDIVIWRSL